MTALQFQVLTLPGNPWETYRAQVRHVEDHAGVLERGGILAVEARVGEGQEGPHAVSVEGVEEEVAQEALVRSLRAVPTGFAPRCKMEPSEV